MQKNFIEFDLKAKEIQGKCASLELNDKVEGITQMLTMFGKC